VTQKTKTTDREVLEHMAIELEQAVYTASVKFYERAEGKQLIFGNGHHMAQNLGRAARAHLLSRDHDDPEPLERRNVVLGYEHQ